MGASARRDTNRVGPSTRTPRETGCEPTLTVSRSSRHDRPRHDGRVTGPRQTRQGAEHQRRSVERGAVAVGLAGLAAFQAALAIGTPWGRASYGGAHIGVLPSRLRVVSAGAALLYSGLSVAIVSRRTPLRVRRHVLTGITALMGVGAVLNGISPSWPERATWTPTTALLAALAWRARRDG